MRHPSKLLFYIDSLILKVCMIPKSTHPLYPLCKNLHFPSQQCLIFKGLEIHSSAQSSLTFQGMDRIEENLTAPTH